MARLRYNGLTATLGADLLTAGTTITFTAALTHAAGAVPTITGTDYIPLAVLDTDGTVLEIVHLTAYTSGATTGTVTRAQESTTAADRATGLTVVNGLTVADVDAKADVDEVAARLVTTTAVTGTTTLTSANLGHVVICTGTTANYTVTLPTAVGNTGETICVKAADSLTKLVTVDGDGTETVAGAASVVLWAGETLTLFSDGANWLTLHRIRRAMAAASFRASSMAIPDSTLTQVTGMTVDFDTSGLVNFGDSLVVARAGLYRIDVTTMWDATATAWPNFGTEIHINGIAVFDINQAVTGDGYPAAALSQMLELAAGDTLTMKVVHGAGAGVQIYGNASGRGTRMALSEVLA